MSETYKRFLLFGFDDFYPEGGAGDVLASADTLKSIREFIDSTVRKRDHYEVLDLQERQWVDL